MILGIVGAEAAKFTKLGKERARDAISRRIAMPEFYAVSSGHCHLGGIDIWAEELAVSWRKFDPSLIFAPKVLNWKGGFYERNVMIVSASNYLLNIVVDQYPVEFGGMKFNTCYHCISASRQLVMPKEDHVKSGGCWTMWRAQEMGKQVERLVIKNY